MKIEIMKCLQDNYSYLIIDETNKNACVIDPGESTPIINFLKNKDINLKYILLLRDNSCFVITKKKKTFHKKTNKRKQNEMDSPPGN